MKASDVMRAGISTVGPLTPVLDAVRLLLKTNQRALPVVDDVGLLVGIISEGDFLHRAELDVDPVRPGWFDALFSGRTSDNTHARSNALLVKDLMNAAPVCVDEDASLDDVVAAMDARRISQVPVVSQRHVVGLVTRTELLTTVERRLADATRTAESQSG